MSGVISRCEWIEDELQSVDLGDQRLDRRMALVLEELAKQPEKSVYAATSGHKELMGAYRFFRNGKVNGDKVLAPHRQATERRVAQQRRVLAIQDTTQLDFSGREPIKGAGYLEGEHSQGFFLHPLWLVTEERLALGTLWFKLWSRSQLEIRASRRERPIEEKESVRWLEGYREACALARRCPQTQIISVQDAEADVFELPVLAQEQAKQAGGRAEFIFRAAQNRRTDSPEGKLWAELLASPLQGVVTFRLPRRQKQPARQAVVEVRYKEVTVRAPRRSVGPALPDIKVWAVLATEVGAPEGGEPVEWLLLSSLPVTNFEEAVQVLEWYGCRWEVEIFFRVFKVGCKVERLQFEQIDEFLPAFALYMIIAWRLLYVTKLGRAAPEMSCEGVFDETEWKSVWTVTRKEPPPRQSPSLREMILMIAQLGGYKGRTGDGEPGPQAMWQGLTRMADFALAWKSFGPKKQRAYG